MLMMLIFSDFLIEDLQVTLNIDSSKIYITGFSGGAMMTYRLGAELSDIVAAIAPVAGSIGGIWHEWPEDSSIYTIPEPLNPIPIIIFHGTEDYNVPYDGGWVRNEFGPFEFNLYFCSVNESLSFWVENNGCESNPSINISDNEKIIKKTFSNEIDNSEVILYKFVNGGHEWFGSSWFPHSVISINDLIWEFFESHPKK